ncbi:hypothetical protein DL96DRAFT_1638391 [Flagelloscypha sp. PMI_526]|nr:hypothetical protein DL96DRAFT_1638391 [Flagelloscypha sp. PMI_526]
MTQNALVPFPPVPLDISREIFEHVALSDSADRFSVSLISPLVQEWTDPYIFHTIHVSSQPRAERFHDMLYRTPKSGRFARACLFVRTLAIYVYGVEMPWEGIALHFPQLVVLYRESNEDADFLEGHKDQEGFEPPSIPTLRRLGGGYGYRTLCGHWGCVQGLTHLDLSPMYSCDWPTLGKRGLRLLSSLTHLCFDLDEEQPESMKQQLKVLPPLFPPSLLLCLVCVSDIDFWIMKRGEGTGILNFSYQLDDRLLICTGEDNQAPHQWILKVDWSKEIHEWTGQCNEEDTQWVQGLNMVIQRRKVLSRSDSYVLF